MKARLLFWMLSVSTVLLVIYQPADQPVVRTNDSSAFPVICHVEKRNKMITIKTGPEGLVYSVKSKDGTILFENVSEEILRASAPEIHRLVKTAMAPPREESSMPVWDHQTGFFFDGKRK